MHIDFAPPSNRTYNNAGSSRQLANYMEHEDLERMEKGIYTEDFFNLTDDNIYKSKVIKDIDSNIEQLLKTDAKFYAVHVSPLESEFRVLGNTEQEKAAYPLCSLFFHRLRMLIQRMSNNCRNPRKKNEGQG